MSSNAKSISRELAGNIRINDEFFILQFFWDGQPPKAGQFFMLKPEHSSVFLPRPISIFEFNPQQNFIKFLIAKAGRGTVEMSALKKGDKVLLTGPFGNAWADFLPENGKVALAGGSAGVAPLAALTAERPDYNFHFFAGFKNGFFNKEDENTVLGHAVNSQKLVVSAENGINALPGRIVDYIFEPQNYDVIFACGSKPMLQAVKKKSDSKNVPCFVSMESRMACGSGACLGCTIQTTKGNRRCCTDGPIFPAGDVLFND